MNLIDAVKSGKDFKRKGDWCWIKATSTGYFGECYPGKEFSHAIHSFKAEDMLAEDWIVKLDECKENKLKHGDTVYIRAIVNRPIPNNKNDIEVYISSEGIDAITKSTKVGYFNACVVMATDVITISDFI